MKAEHLVAILLSVFCAGAARPGEVILESSLQTLELRESARTRLELGSEFYRGEGWSGLRNVLRLERAFNPSSAWSITLPWLYSSEGSGLGGRGDLRGAVDLAPPGLSFLRLGAEFHLPFAREGLEPLQQRRAFLRWSLRARLRRGRQGLELGLNRSAELRGLLGSEEGEPFPIWGEGDLRWTLGVSERLETLVNLRTAFRGGDLLWTEWGAGVALIGRDLWRLELAAGAIVSEQEAPFPSMRLRLALRRDFPDPVIEEEDGGIEDLARTAEEAASSDAEPVGEESPAAPPLEEP